MQAGTVMVCRRLHNGVIFVSMGLFFPTLNNGLAVAILTQLWEKWHTERISALEKLLLLARRCDFSLPFRSLRRRQVMRYALCYVVSLSISFEVMKVQLADSLSVWNCCVCVMCVFCCCCCCCWFFSQFFLFGRCIASRLKKFQFICASPRLSEVAFETVPMFVWFTSRPFKDDRPMLPLSTPPSSRLSMVWCPWFCARS